MRQFFPSVEAVEKDEKPKDIIHGYFHGQNPDKKTAGRSFSHYSADYYYCY